VVFDFGAPDLAARVLDVAPRGGLHPLGHLWADAAQRDGVHDRPRREGRHRRGGASATGNIAADPGPSCSSAGGYEVPRDSLEAPSRRMPAEQRRPSLRTIRPRDDGPAAIRSQVRRCAHRRRGQSPGGAWCQRGGDYRRDTIPPLMGRSPCTGFSADFGLPPHAHRAGHPLPRPPAELADVLRYAEYLAVSEVTGSTTRSAPPSATRSTQSRRNCWPTSADSSSQRQACDPEFRAAARGRLVLDLTSGPPAGSRSEAPPGAAASSSQKTQTMEMPGNR
jgi:hypothetical protein